MPKINFYNRGQGLVGIIIVLMIVSLLGGGLYVYLSRQIPKVPETPSKSAEENVTPANNWESFRSEKHNYEIKYPQTLEIEEVGEGVLTTWRFPLADESEKISRNIFLVVKDNSKKSSALSFTRRNLGVCQTEKDLTDFARISCDNKSQKTISSVYLKNSKAYIISLEIMVTDINYFRRTEPMNFLSEIEIYDLMLSAFRFLE